MSTVLTREALEDSPLADLHTLASELGLDGYRRLRKADLVDAILDRRGSGDSPDGEDDADDAEKKPARRSRRGGRGRSKVADVDADAATEGGDDTTDEDEKEAKPRRSRARSRSRAKDDETSSEAAEDDADADDDADEPKRGRSRGRSGGGDEESREPAVAEGVIELLGNGSAFVRVSPPEPSDDDVYVSAAQVRRCELVSGDTVTGPVRAPRRSERYASLQRVDTINGKPADEVAEGTPFDELPCTLPSERFALGSDEPTLKAIEWLTPIGRGSRVTVVGAARAGKSEALRRLAGALDALEDVEVSLVLSGVRPEELSLVDEGLEPVASLSFAASAEARGQAVERALDTAKRVAARGGHAALLIDTLDGLPAGVAHRTLASARRIVDGGSLTVVATASAAHGGETTVIALDAKLTATGRLPALDLVASGTLRPELLVGDAGAEAIAQARATALGD